MFGEAVSTHFWGGDINPHLVVSCDRYVTDNLLTSKHVQYGELLLARLPKMDISATFQIK
jgi:hypothetical protein